MLNLDPETVAAQKANLDAHRKEIKRQIRLAVKLGTTVPYDLGTLLDHGASADTIRKIYRPSN